MNSLYNMGMYADQVNYGNSTSQNNQGTLQSGQYTTGNNLTIDYGGQTQLGSTNSFTVPNYQYYPHYIQQGSQYVTNPGTYIREVSNGWIVYKDGKESVCLNKEDILQHL